MIRFILQIEYQDHQSPYYGLGMPQGGHQFNPVRFPMFFFPQKFVCECLLREIYQINLASNKAQIKHTN